MIDNLKEFISEALCQPSDYVTYFASVKLAEMYPGAAIIENESGAFNLPEYAEAGLCSIWRHEAVHCQSQTNWRGVEDGLEREIENGWFSVLWPDRGKDYFIDVVYLTWSDAGCETTRRWIIAETEVVAENFLRAVCAYCDEVHGEILVYEDDYWTNFLRISEGVVSLRHDGMDRRSSVRSGVRQYGRSADGARSAFA